jgi:hypothetical protein
MLISEPVASGKLSKRLIPQNDFYRAHSSCFPRSGLERSDFVLWSDADLAQRQLLCRLSG